MTNGSIRRVVGFRNWWRFMKTVRRRMNEFKKQLPRLLVGPGCLFSRRSVLWCSWWREEDTARRGALVKSSIKRLWSITFGDPWPPWRKCCPPDSSSFAFLLFTSCSCSFDSLLDSLWVAFSLRLLDSFACFSFFLSSESSSCLRSSSNHTSCSSRFSFFPLRSFILILQRSPKVNILSHYPPTFQTVVPHLLSLSRPFCRFFKKNFTHFHWLSSRWTSCFGSRRSHRLCHHRGLASSSVGKFRASSSSWSLLFLCSFSVDEIASLFMFFVRRLIFLVLCYLVCLVEHVVSAVGRLLICFFLTHCLSIDPNKIHSKLFLDGAVQ